MEDPHTTFHHSGIEIDSGNEIGCIAAPPFGRALFRVIRSIVFDDVPVPELDALPLAQLRLLWTIRHYGEETMKDFSERLGVTQSTVTQLADRLVKRGLIDRSSDPTDRRVVRLHLSTYGLEILERAEAAKSQLLEEIWEALDPEEQTEVLQGLETLASCAEAVRTRLGRSVPVLPDHEERDMHGDTHSSQPVVDLMALRVRGRSTG